ncbi:TPA: lipocalin-like domain-containing protein [Flavobacterium psychrophilum]|uniref:lipocalin-like domain-containing protein n=1 Tax=Flavobacterium psychrophilum TaxID=96345 RepID=UPI00073ED7DA|nr:lipocalin-like domain-containing protein [Flavobacterium psychrophilum]SNB96946.1 conserved hypothetical protein [Flavobacterium psychrophilum]GAQ48060.1 hypothetical protein FPK15_contig00004-0056 [Flavobacterium psychrophilum]GAW89090.1 hypothetical protein FPS14_contig00015-0026 [Flavobacterium psychrophilum]GEJ32460.1 hypothetical protein FPN181_contig00014-0062 [Flavobacterium psychrophilum]GEJ35745.1 hypothetical protein FPN187_contig00022-0040 [Flavobacterium psychrophilum]
MKRILFTISILLNVAFFYTYVQNNWKVNKSENSKIETNKIVGTWKLVAFADLDTVTGKWIYPFGKTPKGYFTYTKNMIVNLNVSAEEPLHISADSSETCKINLDNYIWHHSFGYFGSYSVNLKKSVITHHVKGGTITYYIDTDQPRPFSFRGDTLVIGDNKTRKRLLIRAD